MLNGLIIWLQNGTLCYASADKAKQIIHYLWLFLWYVNPDLLESDAAISLARSNKSLTWCCWLLWLLLLLFIMFPTAIFSIVLSLQKSKQNFTLLNSKCRPFSVNSWWRLKCFLNAVETFLCLAFPRPIRTKRNLFVLLFQDTAKLLPSLTLWPKDMYFWYFSVSH